MNSLQGGLFENWLSIETRQKKQKQAIEDLNHACGTKYTESWPSKMQGRGYSLERVPTNVRHYMMRVVLKEIFPKLSEKERMELIIFLT